MRKNIIYLCLFLLLCSYTFALEKKVNVQNHASITTHPTLCLTKTNCNYASPDNNKEFTDLQPSLDNIIYWFSISTNEWEDIMKKTALKTRRIENGCVTYSKDMSSDNYSFVISKCPNRKIIMRLSDFGVSKDYILNPLLSELENYFYIENAGGFEFRVTKNNRMYVFNVLRTETLTALIIEMY